MQHRLRLATAQFNVSGNIAANLDLILKQINEASVLEAEIVHFSECCLTGYPDIDIINCSNEPEIAIALERIREAAKANNIWVVIGTHFFEDGRTLPYNSLFVYDSLGREVVRYDKRVLAGAPGKSDRAHYAEGKQPKTFTINGIKCGLIICHEWRYPELFREYQKAGVNLLFHSFYDGKLSAIAYKNEGIELEQLIVGSERGNAANNYLWLSIANTSNSEQVFPAMVVHPDGSIANQARRNTEEIIITEIDLEKEFIDPAKYGRKRITELFPGTILSSASNE